MEPALMKLVSLDLLFQIDLEEQLLLQHHSVIRVKLQTLIKKTQLDEQSHSQDPQITFTTWLN